MKRPLTLFPARVFLDQPGCSPARGMAVRRVRDGVVMFQAEDDPRQILGREEYLLTAYDLGLSAGQADLLAQVVAHEAGYAWDYVGSLPGTRKKLTLALKKELSSLVLRGVLSEADGRYVITEHGRRILRAHSALTGKGVVA